MSDDIAYEVFAEWDDTDCIVVWLRGRKFKISVREAAKLRDWLSQAVNEAE